MRHPLGRRPRRSQCCDYFNNESLDCFGDYFSTFFYSDFFSTYFDNHWASEQFLMDFNYNKLLLVIILAIALDRRESPPSRADRNAEFKRRNKSL